MASNRPREIRKLVQQQFADIEPCGEAIEHESLLIRNGEYCGHRYQSEHLTAIWFLEENEIKFYDQAGHLLRVLCAERLAQQFRSDAA
jgi:hypothetical protein